MKQIWISKEMHEKLRESSFHLRRPMIEIANEALYEFFYSENSEKRDDTRKET